VLSPLLAPFSTMANCSEVEEALLVFVQDTGIFKIILLL
jgi:hypothetical protein